MKTTITLLCLTLLLSCSAFTQITYDTVKTMSVGPGMIYTHYTAPSVPWEIDVLQVDLGNPYLRIESVKANDSYAGMERTSSMAARRSAPGHRVIGAINADFYDTGNGKPINVQVAQGEFVRGPAAGLSTIGFTDANRPAINRVALAGTVICAAGRSAIHNVNQTRNTDQLILYNSFMGASTATNTYGTEVRIRPLTRWIVNDTVVCVVDTIVSNVGSLPIPKGAAVLSGHGVSDAFLKSSMHLNDTVKIVMTIAPGPAKIREMLGGYPRIVKDGADYVDKGYAEEGGPDHTYQRHNRTAIGFSADTSKLYLITIDGRTTASLGMTLKEVSSFMRAIGVYQGLNFDGGGSTTMVINNAVVNHPTDGGGERAVANALLAVSTAPIDTLVKAELTTEKVRVFRGESFRFSANGWDKYGNILTLDAANAAFTVAPRLGSITPAGVYMAGTKPDSGYVYFLWKNRKIDSAYVIIKGVKRISITPDNIMTDSVRTVQYKAVVYDADNAVHTIGSNEYRWSVTDPAVASIDTNGVLKGRSTGTTRVIASYDAAADTATITIEIGRGAILLDSMETASSWIVSGMNIDTAATRLTLSDEMKTMGKRGFRVDYAYTYTGSTQTFVFLEKDIAVFGVPDSFYVDLRADSAAHRVSVLVTDDNGEQFRYYTNRLSQKIPEFDHLSINAATPSFVSSSSVFNYPIRLKRIEVQLTGSRQAGQRYTGTFYLDNFRLSYPSSISTSVARGIAPKTFAIEQNFPNPFNPATKIRFTLPEPRAVSLKIYDILGKEIAVLVNESLQAGSYTVTWNARTVPSGVYFYQIRAGGWVETRRMVVLK